MNAIVRGPRWIYLAVLVGLAGFAVVAWPWLTVNERVRAAAEGLRDSPVYVAPAAPDVVDEQHAREAIGDRAIVVAYFENGPLSEYQDETTPALALCHDLAELVPSNLVVIYAQDVYGDYQRKSCAGPAFPDPTLQNQSAQQFMLGLVTPVDLASMYRTTADNVTPEIEQYVLAFDAAAAKQYGEIPRRSQVGDTVTFWRIALVGLAIVSATVVLFLLLRRAGHALRANTSAERARTRRRTSLDARLNLLADRVLHPRGEPDAEAAKDYILVLHAFREATNDERLDGVEQRIAKLEITLR